MSLKRLKVGGRGGIVGWRVRSWGGREVIGTVT